MKKNLTIFSEEQKEVVETFIKELEKSEESFILTDSMQKSLLILENYLTEEEKRTILIYIHKHNDTLYKKEKKTIPVSTNFITWKSKQPIPKETILITQNPFEKTHPIDYDLYCLKECIFSYTPTSNFKIETILENLKPKLPTKDHPMFLEIINTLLLEIMTKSRLLFQKIKTETEELQKEMQASPNEIEQYLEQELLQLDYYDILITYLKSYRYPIPEMTIETEKNHLLFTPFIQSDIKQYFKGELVCYLLNHSLIDMVQGNSLRIKTYQQIQQIRNGSIRILRDRIDTNTYVIFACFVKKVNNSQQYREFLSRRLRDYKNERTNIINNYYSQIDQAIQEGQENLKRLQKTICKGAFTI